MKIRFVILAMTATLMANSVAQAQDFGLTLGLRQTTADITGYNVSGSNGMQLGALAAFQFGEMLWGRSGFLYTQRNFTAKTTGFNVDYKLTNIDIPLTVLVKFSDFAGVFAGPVLSMNQSKSCDISNGGPCEITDLNTSIFPISIGVSFKFAPQMGGELVYELPVDLSRDVKRMQSVGANFVVYFE